MIAYLDTSALVKAYVQEAGSDQVLEHLHSADIAAAHESAYVEALFGRLRGAGSGLEKCETPAWGVMTPRRRRCSAGHYSGR